MTASLALRTGLRLALCGALAAACFACRDEGPGERAGRKMDEALEKLRRSDEGAIERAGREVDEALEDAGDALEDARDELADEVHELREKAADAIEGD